MRSYTELDTVDDDGTITSTCSEDKLTRDSEIKVLDSNLYRPV